MNKESVLSFSVSLINRLFHWS